MFIVEIVENTSLVNRKIDVNMQLPLRQGISDMSDFELVIPATN